MDLCRSVLAKYINIFYYVLGESVMYLTEEKLYEIIDDCESRDNYSPLIRILGEVYSDIASLSRSFLQNELNSPIDVMLDKAGGKIELCF